MSAGCAKVSRKVLTPFVSADAWVVADGHSGAVLAGSRHLERMCVASMTKITTASVVLTFARHSPGLLSETVSVSRLAAATIGTTANLHTGDTLTVMDLLYGLMLPSGNDAAMVRYRTPRVSTSSIVDSGVRYRGDVSCSCGRGDCCSSRRRRLACCCGFDLVNAA